MKMNAIQRTIGSKGAAIEAALKTVAKCDLAQLPDYLRQYGAECAEPDNLLYGKQDRFIYEALTREVGTPIHFDAKLAKWIRSAFSKDNERRYLQWAHVERAEDGTVYVLGVDGIVLHAVIVSGADFVPGHMLRIDTKGNVFDVDRAALWPTIAGLVYERAAKPTSARGKKVSDSRLVAPKPYSFTQILPKSGLKPATLQQGEPLLVEYSNIRKIFFEIEQTDPDSIRFSDLVMNVALHERVMKLNADWKTYAQTPYRPLFYVGHYQCFPTIALVMPLAEPKS